MASLSSFVISSRYWFWISITRILSKYCFFEIYYFPVVCLVVFLMSFFCWFYLFGLACIYIFRMLSIVLPKYARPWKILLDFFHSFVQLVIRLLPEWSVTLIWLWWLMLYTPILNAFVIFCEFYIPFFVNGDLVTLFSLSYPRSINCFGYPYFHSFDIFGSVIMLEQVSF